MQISKQRDIEDPKNFAQAYSFHPVSGFYMGMIPRQESPLEPGHYLMPAYATEKRPTFLEGHRPRWNGENWELVKREEAQRKAISVESAVAGVKDELSKQLDAVIKTLVKSEVQEQANKMHAHFTRVAVQNHNAMSETVGAELRNYVETRVDKEIEKIMVRIETVMAQVLEIEKRAHDVHAQTLNAAHGVLEMMQVESAEVRSWWQFWKRNKPIENASETNLKDESGV